MRIPSITMEPPAKLRTKCLRQIATSSLRRATKHQVHTTNHFHRTQHPSKLRPMEYPSAPLTEQRCRPIMKSKVNIKPWSSDSAFFFSLHFDREKCLIRRIEWNVVLHVFVMPSWNTSLSKQKTTSRPKLLSWKKQDGEKLTLPIRTSLTFLLISYTFLKFL